MIEHMIEAGEIKEGDLLPAFMKVCLDCDGVIQILKTIELETTCARKAKLGQLISQLLEKIQALGFYQTPGHSIDLMNIVND